jgi:hypothetical protein
VVRALFDTNILIDVVEGRVDALAEIERYSDRAISIVSWIEVMVGASDVTAAATHTFLSRFNLVGLDGEVAEIAVKLRQDYRLKLPDAIIWACARREGRLLVTRDLKDFPKDDPGIRAPYGRVN